MGATATDGIGAKVRRLRLERGWTQQELADEAGLTSMTVSNVERTSRGIPRLETVGKLARALGVSFSDLLGEG